MLNEPVRNVRPARTSHSDLNGCRATAIADSATVAVPSATTVSTYARAIVDKLWLGCDMPTHTFGRLFTPDDYCLHSASESDSAGGRISRTRRWNQTRRWSRTRR